MMWKLIRSILQLGNGDRYIYGANINGAIVKEAEKWQMNVITVLRILHSP